MILTFVIVVQAIIFLGHWFLFRSFLFFFGWQGLKARLALRVVSTFLSVTFIFSTITVSAYSNWPVRWWYMFSTAWMGFFFLFFVAACLARLFDYLGRLLTNRSRKKLLASFFLGLAFILGVYGIVNSSRPRITNQVLRLPNIPEEWRGRKVVLVSDVHLGQIREEGFSRRTADLIKEQRPEVVFIAGDFYDGVAADLARLTAPFADIDPYLGTYFVTGNHEEFSDSTVYANEIRSSGIRLLEDEKINMGGMQIIGVDYSNSSSPESFRSILKKMGINKDKPSILIKHSPANYAIAAEEGVSLQLSGHTHAGQIFPINFITSLVYQGHDYGLTRVGEMQIITSSGAGTWGVPMRIGTIPEIVVIRFE